ncbi:hypothetical protein QUF95_22230 [Paenibacillus silvae]|nr:hypothetical protein [Paenibacillus silvae]
MSNLDTVAVQLFWQAYQVYFQLSRLPLQTAVVVFAAGLTV